MSSGRTAIWMALLIAVALSARLAYVRNASIVVDEFEHLHAAYLVSQGQRPYVDFFEHHTPLFYYLGAAVLPMRSPSLETPIYARYLALAFNATTILLAWWFVRRVFGRTEALVVACLLLGNFHLFCRGSLSYLDTYAAPLVMLSALCLAGSRGRPWRAFASSIALGLAILFTQKAVVAVCAPAFIFLARAWHERGTLSGRASWLRDIAAYAAGALVPAALLTTLLGVNGLGDFFRDNVLLNMAWKARHFPTRELAILAVTDGAVYTLAIAGAAAQLWKLLRRGLVVSDEDLPALFLTVLGAGIVLLPVVWEEYFVLLVPFAVVVAGVALTRWSRQHLWANEKSGPLDTKRWRLNSWAVLVLFAVTLLNVFGRKLAPSNPLSSKALLAVFGLWFLIAVLIRVTTARGASPHAVLWFAFLLAFPFSEQADWIHHNSNAEQRERLAYVLSHSSPHDPVFDGYSGYGVFRPHAYRYWFLHEEVQQMLSEEQKGPDIVRALAERKPPIVIVDQWVHTLPSVVQDYIAAHYVDTPFDDIKRRRDRVGTAAAADAPLNPAL